MKENSLFKFRAWDKRRKRMVEVTSINFRDKTIQEDTRYAVNRKLYFDEIKLMQGWTPEYQPELTIYRGDIINAHWFYAKHDPETLGVYEDEINLECVEIIEVRGVLGFYFEGDFLPLAFVPIHEESFEIIGSIYENPELLKEQNK